MSRTTRLTLIQKAQESNNQDAWNEFVNIYQQYLYNVIRNMNIQHHDCEEILQEVFLKVWDKLVVFQYHPSKGRFRYWLCTICKNSVIDFIRKQQVQAQKVEEIETGEAENHLYKIDTPELEKIADYEWKNFIANRALENIKKLISEKELNCFTKFVEGNSIQKIATDLELAENSVYIYKAKVQELLQKEVKNLDHDLS